MLTQLAGTAQPQSGQRRVEIWCPPSGQTSRTLHQSFLICPPLGACIAVLPREDGSVLLQGIRVLKLFSCIVTVLKEKWKSFPVYFPSCNIVFVVCGVCMLHLVFCAHLVCFRFFVYNFGYFANFLLMLHYPKIWFKKGQNVVPGIVGHYNV
jgi:hypothetical protein